MSEVSTITQQINLLDCKFVDSSATRYLWQASAYRINVIFMSGEARHDGTGRDFSLIVKSSAGEVFENAGVWTDEEDGEGYIDIDATDLSFSGVGYTVIFVYNGSKCADFCLDVKASGTPAPSPGTVVDWSDYTGYENTATDGPYTAGTGIAFGTADVNGKVPINSTSTDAVWGAITGTLADQTDLNDALDLKADDDEVVKLDAGALQTVKDDFEVSPDSGFSVRLRATVSASVVRFLNVSKDIFSQILSTETSGMRIDFDGTGTNDFRIRSIPNDENSTVLQVDEDDNTRVNALRARPSLTLPLIDEAGATQATLSASGIALTSKTASLPVTTDASKNLVTLSPQETAQVSTDTNAETLSADKVLTTSSEVMQFLDPNGADRDIDLPATGRFAIKNTGASGLVLDVYKSDGTTLVDTVENGVTLTFISTAVDTWTVLG